MTAAALGQVAPSVLVPSFGDGPADPMRTTGPEFDFGGPADDL